MYNGERTLCLTTEHKFYIMLLDPPPTAGVASGRIRMPNQKRTPCPPQPARDETSYRVRDALRIAQGSFELPLRTSRPQGVEASPLDVAPSSAFGPRLSSAISLGLGGHTPPLPTPPARGPESPGGFELKENYARAG